MSKNTAKYGNYYFCVKTNLSSDGEIYLTADSVEITQSGGLIFYQESEEKGKSPNMGFSASNWKSFYAASWLDGHPVAVDHWGDKTDASTKDKK